ncbi:hypothetical protein KCG48_05010 [Proteiniclasticum sp. BAD-10]|uniref:Uncharacterized protein n=1 Tax=Proteiniclasticum sediminis TaxID=2804028 RepID=A0A941CN93_9CLOT|nr:hypothetical protein [Proteiniclasticum sediminis]MBR0575700.1 hypothetical protein [Proteiniclasticum sediminis]
MREENPVIKFIQDFIGRRPSGLFIEEIGKPVQTVTEASQERSKKFIGDPVKKPTGGMIFLTLHTPPPANRLKDIPRVEFKESEKNGGEEMKSESITIEIGGDEVAKIVVTNIPKRMAKQIREELEALEKQNKDLEEKIEILNDEHWKRSDRIYELKSRADVLEKMAKELDEELDKEEAK